MGSGHDASVGGPPQGCRLKNFFLAGPDLGELAGLCHRLGIQVELQQTDEPKVLANIVGPRGTMDLSS